MLPQTQKYAKPTFVLVLLMAALWRFWALPYSPLPWFDETFFASITHSFIHGEGFHLAVCPLQTNGEQVLIYGPIYFLLTGLITKTLGFGLFSFRLANLLGAIVSIFLFSRIIKKLGWRSTTLYLMTILLAFDVIFLQNAHSGRMDLVALAFFLGAINLHLTEHSSIKQHLFIALLGTLAVLTTLRIAIMVLPFFALVFFTNIKNKQYQQAATLLITSVLLYAIWIGIGFGSLSNFLAAYTQNRTGPETNHTLISSFLGGNLSIPFHQYPMVALGLLSIALLFKQHYQQQKFWLILLPIPFFYLLVKDTGAYSALVVPFWYLIIGMAFEKQAKSNTSYLNRLTTFVAIALLLGVNGGIFLLKSATIATTIPQRNNKQLTAWVSEHLPAQSRVVGDDRFYYAVINNHSDFQYIQRVQSNEARALYHKEEFQPNYLFISSQTTPDIIEAYKQHFVFGDTFTYTPITQQNLVTRLIQKLPMQIHTSLEGTLIQVTPKKILESN
jgi:hypothetical protein